MYIGFSEQTGRVYYSARGFKGHIISPTPILLPVIFTQNNSTDIPWSQYSSIVGQKFIFREIEFNPVTRTKTGIFYQQEEMHEWDIPHNDNFRHVQNGTVTYELEPEKFHTFQRHLISYDHKFKTNNLRVVLGNKNAHSFWKIVQLEAQLNGEEYVTLKSIGNLGVLPDLDLKNIPTDHHKRIVDCINQVVDTAYHIAPINVIDQCRNAASAMINAWIENKTGQKFTKDLLDAAESLTKKNLKPARPQKLIAGTTGMTLARLHSRGKSTEQQKRPLLAITDDDGQLALQCLSSIMRELGFAI